MFSSLKKLWSSFKFTVLYFEDEKYVHGTSRSDSLVHLFPPCPSQNMHIVDCRIVTRGHRRECTFYVSILMSLPEILGWFSVGELNKHMETSPFPVVGYCANYLYKWEQENRLTMLKLTAQSCAAQGCNSAKMTTFASDGA